MKVLLVSLSVLLLPTVARPAQATPSCKKYYEPGAKGEKLLSCKFRGGVRPTRELGGKKFLTVVGTCYDFDVVSLKSCGCRMFEKASLCCGKGRASKTCHWRVGKSSWVDCKKYKQPEFGLSGSKETPDCRRRRDIGGCGTKRHKQMETDVGPCKGVRSDCEDNEKGGRDHFNMKCGPALDACGCKVDRACTPPDALKCYDDFIKDKELIACYWRGGSQNSKKECHAALKKKRGQ